MSDSDIPSQPVQEKIHCVYITGVTNEPSPKRPQQSFKVSATCDITAKALEDDVITARPTEKLDGTCCLVDIFNGQPWLWARHDRKASKAGERRQAQHKKALAKVTGEEATKVACPFQWKPTDVKEVPVNWIPASRLEVKDGFVLPDSIGHTPGWVPLDQESRQHVWHLSAVDLSQGLALVLREDTNPGQLVICAEHLSCLNGQTCELIGTNVNANPYGLGSKKCPLHLLAPHGCLSTQSPDVTDFDAMTSWLSSDTSSAQLEGLVWHCANGQLHKLHRHHLNLSWPVTFPYLTSRKVRVNIDLTLCENATSVGQKGGHNLFSELAKLSGQCFDDFHHLSATMTEEEEIKS